MNKVIKQIRLYLLLYSITFLLPINAVNVVVHNTILVSMYARWEFAGDYFRRDIPAATKKTVVGPDGNPLEEIVAGIKGVNDWRLHIGFSDVHTKGAQIGQAWGTNPETGEPLVFTAQMLNGKGECWGVKPDVYSAPLGQAVYNNFSLTVVPKKNPADNNNWWPSFEISRIDANVFDPLIKAFAPVKKFFSNIGKYGAEGILIINALAKRRPITGFQLKTPAKYVRKSAQPTPPNVMQERAALIQAKDNLLETDIELQSLYDEEINILDAIKKYSPIFYVHPDDLAGPIAPADFFAGETTMIREGARPSEGGKVVIPLGKVTFRKLSDLTQAHPEKKYFIWHGTPGDPLKYDKRIFYGSNPALYPDGVPMHVTTFYGIKQDLSIDTNYFYIQWLCLFGYNQPYDIKVPLGTIFQGDARDFQNAHEGDLEHVTMKVNAKTGKLEAIEYGAHGIKEGMWLYAPGSTNNPLKEFMVEDGHPIVFCAYGGHGNYPREGVYTRIYGLANDVTKKGKMWRLTEKNIYRTVRSTSAGFNPIVHDDNPDHFGYLDWNGNLGPRGISSYINKDWFGNIEEIPLPQEMRNPIDVHTNHFCPGPNPSATCIRDKAKKSAPPGDKPSGWVKFLFDIGVM
ncbi:MAG TPA: Vps62-related protein [Candidatus Babeliales bacterium]|nr:Vps62-related protein [Candidatus Babeliales bacterium]